MNKIKNIVHCGERGWIVTRLVQPQNFLFYKNTIYAHGIESISGYISDLDIFQNSFFI